jgi:virginiamycin B lyase
MKASAALLVGGLGLAVASEGFGQLTFIPTPGVSPTGITVASDGNVWFTAGNRLGRISSAGVITWFDLPGTSDASSIVFGPDGNLWILRNGAVNVVSQTGALIAEYSYAGGLPSIPPRFIVGPDSALWLGDRTRQSIWRLTTAGVFAEFSVAPVRPDTLCSGPDGSLWFGGGAFGPGIRRMSTAGEVTGVFAVPQPNVVSVTVLSCAPGPDGNVWFATSSSVGSVTPTGSVTQFPVAFPRFYADIISGPIGNLWAAGDQTVQCVIPACPPPPEQDGILRISTSGSQFFYPFPAGRVISDIVRITVGPDGVLWLTGVEGIVRFDPGVLGQQLENIPVLNVAGQLALAVLIALAGVALLRR